LLRRAFKERPPQAAYASPARGEVKAGVSSAPDANLQTAARPRIPRREASEVCEKRDPPKNRGRRECRAPNAPAASRAKNKSTRVSHHRFTGTTGIPCANGFTAYSALSPVIGLVCHRRLARWINIVADLMPASRHQDHTASPSEIRCVRLAHFFRPPHPTPRFVTVAHTPLMWGGTSWVYCCFYRIRKRKIFSAGTGQEPKSGDSAVCEWR